MKKSFLSLTAISLLLFSCGGLESKVEDLAEKRCECKSLENGEDREKCRDELKEMEEKIDKAREEANLKPSELDKLEMVYKDKMHECKEKK